MYLPFIFWFLQSLLLQESSITKTGHELILPGNTATGPGEQPIWQLQFQLHPEFHWLWSAAHAATAVVSKSVVEPTCPWCFQATMDEDLLL